MEMVWVLWVYLQVQGAWLPLPLDIDTREECRQIGAEVIAISQDTTKNALKFICTSVDEDEVDVLADDKEAP